MRVLHVEAGRHLYGGARQVLYLLEGLARHGVESVLAAPAGSEIAIQASPHVRELRAIPMGGDLDARLLFRLRRLACEVRPDLVHVHSRRGADLWGGLAARLTGTPAVLSRRVDNPEPRWLVAVKYRPYRRVITISEGIRQVLLAEGLPSAKVICVPSAVRAEEYRRPCDRAAFRRALGIPATALLAGVMAQLIRRKGHRHLFAALPAVLRDHPGLHVVVFGQGPLRTALEREVALGGLAEHVHFLGFRDDLPDLLGCLDLVVHPADMEGLGVSLLQAAAAGLPLIGTRAGGIPEVVRDGMSGLLIDPGDVEALAQAMRRLLAEPELRARLGAGGRRLVAERFDVEAMVSGNIAVYRGVLNEGAA
ncbi:MAG: glycosyltransferase family 4 protein [Gammaproteobacteria bacterium]